MSARIISLLPSATEIVCALGLADQLVGISHECDYPPTIVGRPVLTEPKIDARRASAAIDHDVRALVRDGLSVYRIKIDVLQRLKPDLIITQDQCEVCAVSSTEVERAARDCFGNDVAIVSLKANTLDDILDDIARVAAATDRTSEGAAVIAQMRRRIDAIRERALQVHSRPRVACIEWIEPLMVGGNWIPELVTLAGGRYDLVQPGAHSPTITWVDLVAYAPEAIVVMPCGFKLPQTRTELSQLTDHSEWKTLPAVRNRRVYLADGNAYLNRPGPRIVESAELLAGLIQPGLFAAGIPPGSCARVD
ncbi:MAG: cobalamin-binding protein [Deltaproteobacteria bacterium]|nr:cobalamin-binding protein [Deltaproteobacteria bacterium]MBI3390848.1 cobalamin-binding protein [Deltaproteobacteria bacterium]